MVIKNNPMNYGWNAAWLAWRAICSQAGHFLYLGFSDVFCVMFTEASEGRFFLDLSWDNLWEQGRPLLMFNICTDGNNAMSLLLRLVTAVPRSREVSQASIAVIHRSTAWQRANWELLQDLISPKRMFAWHIRKTCMTSTRVII